MPKTPPSHKVDILNSKQQGEFVAQATCVRELTVSLTMS